MNPDTRTKPFNRFFVACFVIILLLGGFIIGRGSVEPPVVLARPIVAEEPILIERYKLIVFEDGEILMFDSALGRYKQVRPKDGQGPEETTPDGTVEQYPKKNAPRSL